MYLFTFAHRVRKQTFWILFPSHHQWFFKLAKGKAIPGRIKILQVNTQDQINPWIYILYCIATNTLSGKSSFDIGKSFLLYSIRKFSL